MIRDRPMIMVARAQRWVYEWWRHCAAGTADRQRHGQIAAMNHGREVLVSTRWHRPDRLVRRSYGGELNRGFRPADDPARFRSDRRVDVARWRLERPFGGSTADWIAPPPALHLGMHIAAMSAITATRWSQSGFRHGDTDDIAARDQRLSESARSAKWSVNVQTVLSGIANLVRRHPSAGNYHGVKDNNLPPLRVMRPDVVHAISRAVTPKGSIASLWPYAGRLCALRRVSRPMLLRIEQRQNLHRPTPAG